MVKLSSWPRSFDRAGWSESVRSQAAAVGIAASAVSMSLKNLRCTRSFSPLAGMTSHIPDAGPRRVDRGSSVTTPRALLMPIEPASRTSMRCGVTTTIRYLFRMRNPMAPVRTNRYWLTVCAPKTASAVSRSQSIAQLECLEQARDAGRRCQSRPSCGVGAAFAPRGRGMAAQWPLSAPTAREPRTSSARE